MMVRTEENGRHAAPAAFADKGIECLGQGAVNERHWLLLSSYMRLTENLNSRHSKKKARTGCKFDPDAVFLEKILFLPCEFLRDQNDLFLPVLD
jgi:hypothetical protein